MSAKVFTLSRPVLLSLFGFCAFWGRASPFFSGGSRGASGLARQETPQQALLFLGLVLGLFRTLGAGSVRRDVRLEAVGRHQPVGVGVPAIARVGVAQDRRVALGLIGQAQGQIGLGQAVQGLGRVRGGLVLVDHRLEAADRRQRLVVAQVPAPDRHLLAGQLVVDHVDLHARIGGVVALGVALGDFA